MQAKKDENDILAGRAGITFSYDLFGRVTSKNLPNGGQTTTAYNDTPAVSVTATTKITSSLNLVTTSLMDDLGRMKQTQLTSDPQGTVFTDTTYDGRAGSPRSAIRIATSRRPPTGSPPRAMTR